MSATNYLENGILKLFFHGETIPRLAENVSISPNTILYLSLHTSDPGEGGNQNTAETDYGSYQRVPVTRNSAGWQVVDNEVTNVETITFPTCSGGISLVSHWGLGLDDTDEGVLLFKGELEFELSISNGIAPEFESSGLKILVD